MPRKIIALCAFLAALAAFAAGCGDPLTVTARDDGNTVLIAPGDTFQVRLFATPSAGYEWRAIRYDEAVVAPAGEPEFEPAKGIGPGGDMVYTFRGVATGESQLQMHYLKKDDPDTARFRRRLRIVVRVK